MISCPRLSCPPLPMAYDQPPSCSYTGDILRARVDHKDDLITSRLNWLVTSQSFLFAAYATLFRAGGAQQVPGAGMPLLVCACRLCL